MNRLQGSFSFVTDSGLILSGRCSVTFSIMLSVSQDVSFSLWYLRLSESDSTSSGSGLEARLKPDRLGGDVNVSDSSVETSSEVCGNS